LASVTVVINGWLLRKQPTKIVFRKPHSRKITVTIIVCVSLLKPTFPPKPTTAKLKQAFVQIIGKEEIFTFENI
jgi:hypothetical protein